MDQRFGAMGKPAGCLICSRTLSYHQQVCGQICDDWRCKSAMLDSEMAAHRKRAAAALSVNQSLDFPMVVVPDDPVDIDRLPQARKQIHLNFLFELVVQATISKIDGDAAPSDSQPAYLDPPPVMASHVCAVCQGVCCHLGKEHAFLDNAAIRRFINRSGLMDPLEIACAYIAHLPEIAVTDACVYQSDQGCGLPRWMRAGICNTYRCKGLRQAEHFIRCRDTNCLYVVVRKDNRIIRAAFVQRDQIRNYPASNNSTSALMLDNEFHAGA